MRWREASTDTDVGEGGGGGGGGLLSNVPLPGGTDECIAGGSKRRLFAPHEEAPRTSSSILSK